MTRRLWAHYMYLNTNYIFKRHRLYFAYYVYMYLLITSIL